MDLFNDWLMCLPVILNVAEFHGAVTYAFDGIFSWQMYGSAEAIDETGRAYTVL